MANNSDLSFVVIMGASRSAKLMPRYLAQLAAAAIPYHVEPFPLAYHPSAGTLGFCIELYARLAAKFSSYDRLILTDAWDVQYFGNKEDLADRLSMLDPHVLFAGEKNCYPEGFLADKIPGDGPYKFVNGGMLTAAPTDLWKWCRGVESHPEYSSTMIGQQWINRRLVEESPLIRIDRNTELFFCLYGGYEQLEFRNGRMLNTLCGTSPLFAHANGCWPTDELFDKYDKSVS